MGAWAGQIQSRVEEADLEVPELGSMIALEREEVVGCVVVEQQNLIVEWHIGGDRREGCVGGREMVNRGKGEGT